MAFLALYLIFLVTSTYSSGELMDTETIHPDVIYTNDQCLDFIDSTHKYSYVAINYYKSHRFIFGRDFNITLCLERCLPEGKIILLPFKQNVPLKVLREIAKISGVLNVWLSFDVAAGPNCADLEGFRKQRVLPYPAAVLGFCESEEGAQQGYTMGNVKNLLDNSNFLINPGLLYVKLNGKHLDLSDKDINWGSVLFKAHKAIIYRSVTDWKRNEVMKILETNNTKVIWGDVDSGAAIFLRASLLCILLSIVKII